MCGRMIVEQFEVISKEAESVTELVTLYCKASLACFSERAQKKLDEIQKERVKALKLKEAHKLWEELSDVPTDKEGNIDEAWNDFEKGTCVFEIWHWFEDKYNISIASEFMGLPFNGLTRGSK